MVRLEGTHEDPGRLARVPVTTALGIVELGSIAELRRSTEEAMTRSRFRGEPAVLLAVIKEKDTNVLELVDRVQEYVADRNRLRAQTGVDVVLVDDQTTPTRRALSIMQTNAGIGFFMVLGATWLFLGSRIALFTSIGIPFSLAGTFICLNALGMSVNNTVLLGVVIALGMIVDDAVVVVESIYRLLREGTSPLDAAVAALTEVFAPVTTSVMTTIAAFLPLMLLPGILGEFMKVIPLVVTLALFISLFEAYWMLPSHISAANVNFERPSRFQPWRDNATRWIRRRYVQVLLRALRRPALSAGFVVVLFAFALLALASGRVRVNFFESDALRIFYVNVEMPDQSALGDTTDRVTAIDSAIRGVVREDELRGTVAYAGQMFTATEVLFGDALGQVMVSLKPRARDGRRVGEIADAAEAAARATEGAGAISLLRIADGPPVTRPINIKVRGDEFDEITAAARDLLDYLESVPEISDIGTDFRPGNPELVLRHDGDAIQRAGFDPNALNRSLMALVDGEIVTTFQDQGKRSAFGSSPSGPPSARSTSSCEKPSPCLRAARFPR